MKKKISIAILLLGIGIFVLSFSTLPVRAEEGTENTVSSVKLEPIIQKLIMIQEEKTAKLPIYLSKGAVITNIITSQSNFKADYEDGIITITAFNTNDYVKDSDIQLTLYIEGKDSILLPFTKELQVMLEIETKEGIIEELNKETTIDTSKMSAYNRTLYLNALDKRIIAINKSDFFDMKITCIGDSITEGVGLKEGEEKLYSYPAQLGYILDTNVDNLGKGGTSIASYWDSFLPITNTISEDTDLILVMGGVNDCYAGDIDNIGNLATCERGTFYGDTDLLMQSLKKHYPNSEILFITPFPTVTNTSYLSFLPDMLSLSLYADAINELGEKNDIPVYDLYSEAFLDSNDEEIKSRFMYDGVHPNAHGYYLLAEHIAGKVIEMEKENEN